MASQEQGTVIICHEFLAYGLPFASTAPPTCTCVGLQKVDPQIMEQFVDQSPLPAMIILSGYFQVVGAMRTTISNMVGVLPPQLFKVTVSTVGESLAQLMFSVLMTGEH